MSPSPHAAVAGQAVPGNDNGREQAAVEGEQEKADAGMVAAERERVTTRDALIADCRRRAALRGITMHVFGAELFFTWAGLSKSLQSPEAAAIWLDHVGAPR